MNKFKVGDLIPLVTTAIILCISCIDLVRYGLLGNGVAFATMGIVNLLFALCALGAWMGKCAPCYLLITIFGFVLFCITNNVGTTLFNATFLVQAIVSLLGAIGGTVLAIRKRQRPQKITAVFLAAMLLIASVFSGIWGAGSVQANARKDARQEIWQVPDLFEGECERKGTIEKVTYETKAYATDLRTVKKSAYVYLPCGYEEGTKYDVLYLLHGSGDDEGYWLVQNEWNKRMLDNLIDQKVIRPVIVVTPTFYVEDDCTESLQTLDRLSYTFKDELRNDLMPAIESAYSTYAESADEKGFIESRDHRAFAGLSRGSVTTLHSVLCGSLDYFSSFGTFSASRTPLEYYLNHVQKDYSIDYWYVASGAFDFGLSSQLQDYHAILKAEPRLQPGVNTSVAVYPMRYHSQGNWHLALYNFLQIVYG